MHWSFYLRKGVAYVPTTAKTEAGHWLAIEPADVEPVRNAEDLCRLLLKAIRRGNPVVKTPTRRSFPPNVMQRYCGMTSFSAFERTAAFWAITKRDSAYDVYPYRRSTRYRGSWEEDHGHTTSLPSTAPPEEIARQAAERAFKEAHSS